MSYAYKGMMVLYRLTAEDATSTNRRRVDAANNLEKMREEKPSFQAHVGYPVDAGDSFPMIVTSTDTAIVGGVNGQVFLDGNDTLWVRSSIEGDGTGEWLPITNA